MGTTLKQAAGVTLSIWLVVSVLYTLVMLGIGQVIFPFQANGEPVIVNHRIVGEHYVGQNFLGSADYFWGRPSATDSVATGKPEPYNPFNSSPSNNGPTSALLWHDVKGRVRFYLRTTPGLKLSQIPISLVESSGSGLDPDITVGSALIQIPRIAKTTGLSTRYLHTLVMDHVTGGLIGPKSVNVLLLNVAVYTTLHPARSGS